MNFDFLDKLTNATKDENKAQSLIEDLNDFLDKKFSGNDLEEAKRNEISSIQELQEQGKVTTAYRDKMLISRSNILNDYAKATSDNGAMYFVYSKSSSKENCYNLCICEDGMSNKVISVEEDKLPNNVGVDCVLRLIEGKYVFDEKATIHFQTEMDKTVQKLLEEQTFELSKRRVEGNEYEVVEISGDSAWLMDVTKNDGECFEEINISKDILNSISPGKLIQYVDGEYRA